MRGGGGGGGENISFLVVVLCEREGEGEKSKTSFDDLQSSVGRNSSSQELKFITSTRTMLGYQERGISPKIQRRIFWESKFSGLRGVLETSYHSTTFQEVRVLPILDYFYHKGCLALVSALRCYLA